MTESLGSGGGPRSGASEGAFKSRRASSSSKRRHADIGCMGFDLSSCRLVRGRQGPQRRVTFSGRERTEEHAQTYRLGIRQEPRGKADGKDWRVGIPGRIPQPATNRYFRSSPLSSLAIGIFGSSGAGGVSREDSGESNWG